MNKLDQFKNMTYWHCFDCGWGEKGVHADFTFEQAKSWMEDMIGRDLTDAEFVSKIEDWNGEWQIWEGHNSYLVADYAYDEDDWEGSEDW